MCYKDIIFFKECVKVNKVIKLLAMGVLGTGMQQAQATSIVFDYGYDSNSFFDTQAKKDVLEAAGSFFSSRLNDSLSAIDSAGNNHFNANFSNPGVTGSTVTINDFNVAANTLTVFAGGRAIAGSTIGIGGPGGYGASGSQAFFDSFDRGQADVGTTDFAPWGGAITFDTGALWYFDSDVSTVESFSGNDFYSVAIHELGHLLGIGTADSWDNLVSSGSFIGSASNAVYGGDVPLHLDDSHWADGTMSLVDAQDAQDVAMGPSITTGTRKYFTDLDLAGLTDVGWEVSAVPVPAAVYFFGSALLGLGAFRKKSK